MKRIRAFLLDETLRSAGRRFVHLWRPMAAWTLLVWILVGLILSPLASTVFGRIIFRGDRIVVGHQDLLTWIFTPEGAAYILVAGGLAIMGATVLYAGLFRIVTDDMSGQTVSVRQTLFELVPDLPALFRLCLTMVASTLVLLAPLLAGIGGIYFLLLGEYDINYYVYVRPQQWQHAVVLASLWGFAWLVGAAYVLVHSLPTLPAYMDGHRPVVIAWREAWKRTKGRAARILWVLLLCVALWLAVRAAAYAGLYVLSATIASAFTGAVTSVASIVLMTGAYVAGTLVLDVLISFVGFSFVATVLTKFYYEDTDLHAIAHPPPVDLSQIPRTIARFVVRWLHPRRAFPVLAALLLISVGTSWLILRQQPDLPAFTVTAHRAGSHLATENTLAALERSIEAGADLAEIDVQSTRDGEVVVFHDADLMRLARDRRRIDQMDYASLAEIVIGIEHEVPHAVPFDEHRIATLDEFLDRAGGRIGLNIELKYHVLDPALAERVVRRVRGREMEDEVVITSFNLPALRQVQQLAPEIAVGYIAAVSVGDLARLPVQMLAVSRTLATDRLIRAAQRRGIEVHVWTLNDAHLIVEAAEQGADGIITSDPVLAIRIRNELAQLTAPERLLLRMRHLLLHDHEQN